MKKSPSATELAVQYAIQAERLKLLKVAEDSKSLEEFIEFLKKLVQA